MNIKITSTVTEALKTVFIYEDFSNGSYRYALDAEGTILPECHELLGFSFPFYSDAATLAKEYGYTIS